MKKLIAISLLLIGVTFLAWYVQQQTDQKQLTMLAPVMQKLTQSEQQTIATPPVSETANWKQFNHTYFKLTFLYPSELTVGSNNMGLEADEAPNISVYSVYNELNIDVVAVPESKDSFFNPNHYDPKDVEKWDVKKTTEEIFAMNKDNISSNVKNHSVSSIEKIIVAGREAYRFSATGSYTDWQQNSLLDQETTYIFTTNLNGTKIRISYPTGNDLSVKIIESFKFY